jgi:WSC domain
LLHLSLKITFKVSSASSSYTSTLTTIETLTTSATSTDTVPTPASLDFPGATYVGCYADDGNRALPNVWSNTGTDIINSCLQSAISNGDNIFGVQYGAECYTGKDGIDLYDKYGVSDACTVPCDDGSGSVCGGGYTNSVYRVYQNISQVFFIFHLK